MASRRRKRVYEKCPTCGKGPHFLIYCKERKPGATGRMAQSFGGSYRICEACVDRLKAAKAVAGDMAETQHYSRTVTTLAGSYAWLKSVDLCSS